MASKRSTTRKSAAIGLAIVGIAGLSLAAAAQLNATSTTLGATTTVVASCQPVPGTPISATYTTEYAAVVPGYKVTSVVLSGINAACANKSVKISLVDDSNNVIGVEVVGITTAAANQAFTVPAATNIPASAVAKLAVVISG
jgi:hypothetical protein